MLDPLYSVIGWLLAFFYSFFPYPSWGLGVAIILLTCTVMLVLFPLTAKQTRSMIAMQRAAPEIKRIQAQYKDDKQKQNEEVLKFYQENKINPLSGCLPLLMQSPIFIALFGVLRNPQDHIPTGAGRMGDLFRDVCPGMTLEQCDQVPAADRGLHFLTMNLSISPARSAEVTDSLIGRIPYFLIIVLIVALGYYQARQTQVRQKKYGTNQSTSQMQSQMQVMSKVFPFLFGFISWGFPSGVGIYWVTSSAWRIGQQQLVLNKYYDPDHPRGPSIKPVEEKPPSTAEGGNGAGNAGGTAARPHPRSKAKKKRRR